MRPPRACSFDLDGTLLDSGGNADRALVATCEAVAATLPALDAVQLLRANREVWPPYWQDVEDQWTLGGLTGADLSLEVWRRTLEVCGCIDESIVRMARDMHSLHQREALRIFDDVQGVLASLRGRGIALALITNGASDTQREAVEATDLARYFDTIVISAEEGIAKPDPAVLSVRSTHWMSSRKTRGTSATAFASMSQAEEQLA